jgi:hypothetical protein
MVTGRPGHSDVSWNRMKCIILGLVQQNKDYLLKVLPVKNCDFSCFLIQRKYQQLP